MFPNRVISLNNGWNILNGQKAERWQDVVNALSDWTVEIMLKPSTVVSIEGFDIAQDSSAQYYLSLAWGFIIRKYKWESLNMKPEQANASGLYVDNSRDGVTTKVIGGGYRNHEELSTFMLVDCPRLFKSGMCDMFVLLVCAESVGELFARNGNNDLPFDNELFTEANCRAQISEILPFIGRYPVAIVIFSQYEGDLVTEEVILPEQKPLSVERSIEFAPEFYQAGVGILSYFGKVLRQKHPDINAKVKIEQDGNIVRMRVESPTGEHIDTLEEELTQYALVVQGKATPEDILQNPLDVLALKNKFEMAQLEVRQTRELLHYTRTTNDKRIATLEEDVAFLRQTMGAQLMHSNTLAVQSNTLTELVAQQNASHEKLQALQITYAQGLFKDLLGEAHGNQITLNAIRSLEYNLMTGLATIDVQEQMKEALATIQQSSPGLITRIAGQLESAGYGLLATPAFEMLKQLVQANQ